MAEQSGGANGYQTLINAALREYLEGKAPRFEDTLRRIIREELEAGGSLIQLTVSVCRGNGIALDGAVDAHALCGSSCKSIPQNSFRLPRCWRSCEKTESALSNELGPPIFRC
jgi:hypothetical protein